MKKFGRTKTLAILLALVIPAAVLAGCASTGSAAVSDDGTYGGLIINSYSNTDELLEQFPVLDPTPVETQMEKDIQNRLLTGFANWNRGYDAWEAWGNILYTPDSIYDVQGARLTLAEYQASMKVTLAATDLQLGDFHNMVICDDWTAILYDTVNINRQTGESAPGSVTEFVQFKDYGPEMGVRVVEGWGGTKGVGFPFMQMFQTEEERNAQSSELAEIAAMEVPKTGTPAQKYPVKFPTADKSEWAAEMKEIILDGFEAWNSGYEDWVSYTERYFAPDLVFSNADGAMGLEEYRALVRDTGSISNVRRLYFNNILISGDWAAVHYWVSVLDPSTGERTAFDHMEFLKFSNTDGKVKVVEYRSR